MKIGLLVAGIGALAVAAPHYAKRTYHAAEHVVAKAETVVVSDPAAGAKPLDPHSVPPTVIGMNVGMLAYYSTEEPFYDPLRAHADISVDSMSPVKEIKYDANGWPKDVPQGAILQFPVSNAGYGIYPVDCTLSPGWTVDFFLGGNPTTRSGNKFHLTVPKDKTIGPVIKIKAEKAGSLTEFSCRPPSAPPGALFRADYLAEMKPFRIIRFMNWMLANNGPSGKWSERPTPAQPSAIRRGMPVEDMVALANLNHSDPWFTMPFNADEEYQRNFATYVRDHLDPGLKAYVELSNEVWNSSFVQSKQASELGARKYPKADEVQRVDYYYADRVRETMTVWTDVFAGQKQRIVRVLAEQNGWGQRTEYALGHEKTWTLVDAVAVAPYFGDVPFDIPGKGADRVNGILAKMPTYIDTAITNAKNIKTVANKFGLRLIAYEGGPGMNAYAPDMVQDVVSTYHDPRFIPVYKSFLDRWKNEIGGELVLFDYSGDGIWSHLDYTGQKVDEAPKMKAVLDFIHDQPTSQK